MKIGVFGGTFDPIHVGHLIIAEWITTHLNLNRILFIPAGLPPHKQEDEISSGEHRLQMVRLATKGNSRFDVSEIEIQKEGKSYSVETLKQLKRDFGSDTSLYFIIGMDSLIDLPTWYRPDDIPRLAQIVVYPRHSYSIDSAPKKFVEHALILKSPCIDLSSSVIRERIRQGLSVRYMVPCTVEEYIHQQKLYRSPEPES